MRPGLIAMTSTTLHNELHPCVERLTQTNRRYERPTFYSSSIRIEAGGGSEGTRRCSRYCTCKETSFSERTATQV